MNKYKPRHIFSMLRRWLLGEPKSCPSRSSSDESPRLFQQPRPRLPNGEAFSRHFRAFALVSCALAILLAVRLASGLSGRMDAQADKGQAAETMTENAVQGQDSWRTNMRMAIVSLCELQHVMDEADATHVDPDPNWASDVRKAYEESYLARQETRRVIPPLKKAMERLIDGETSPEAKEECESLQDQYARLSKKMVETGNFAIRKLAPIVAAEESQTAKRAAERKTRSWTDEHGNTMTEDEEQAVFDILRRRVESESNPYMRAYWEGFEKRLLKERAKIQGTRGW